MLRRSRLVPTRLTGTRLMRARAGGLAAFAGSALLLAGCATPGTGDVASATGSAAAGSSPVPSALSSALSSSAGSSPVAASSAGSVPASTPASTSLPMSVSESGSGSSPALGSSAAPDWPTLQAAVAAADAQLATAKSEGWWSGPVCSPDIEMHRENAGQDPLSDEQLRAECAANLAEFQSSQQDFAALQALDAGARSAELARVGALLGLPAGQDPTVGQVVVAHGCEQGWITDPADCSGIPAG